MTKKERVLAAIQHKETDRVPKGELAFENEILDKLLAGEKYDGLSPLARQLAVRQLLGIDLIDVHEYPADLVGYNEKGFPIYQSVLGDVYVDNGSSFHLVKPPIEDISEADNYPVPDIRKATTHQLDFYRENSDLFLFTQINGPVSSAYWTLGVEDYMCYCMTDTDDVVKLTEKIMRFEIQRAKLFIQHGADAILMADDIGFNTGSLLPPDIMDEVAYPFYKQFIKEVKACKDIPIFLHTDGYIWDELPKIVDSGFDGIHSLQPSAGMDIAKVKKEFGKDLCLMGNVDLDYLLPFGSEQEVEKEVHKLIETAAQGGGFILSTCNILTNAVKPENALAMYRAAE